METAETDSRAWKGRMNGNGKVSAKIRALELLLAEARLREKQAAKILELSAAPIVIVDRNLMITAVNDGALRTIGYDRQEVVGKMTCAEFQKTPLCHTENCMLKNCMRTGQAVVGETYAETRHGKKIHVHAAFSALLDENGKPYGGMEVIMDTSAEVKRLQGEADRHREYLQRRMAILMEKLQSFRRGDLSITVTAGREDEIAKIIESVDRILQSLRGFVRAAEKIAGGNPTSNVKVPLEKDVISASQVPMIKNSTRS